MKKLTDEQIAVMTIAEQSLPKLKALAERATKADLKILGVELEVIERYLKQAIDNSLVDPEPLFPEGRFPYGKR